MTFRKPQLEAGALGSGRKAAGEGRLQEPRQAANSNGERVREWGRRPQLWRGTHCPERGVVRATGIPLAARGEWRAASTPHARAQPQQTGRLPQTIADGCPASLDSEVDFAQGWGARQDQGNLPWRLRTHQGEALEREVGLWHAFAYTPGNACTELKLAHTCCKTQETQKM